MVSVLKVNLFDASSFSVKGSIPNLAQFWGTPWGNLTGILRALVYWLQGLNSGFFRGNFRGKNANFSLGKKIFPFGGKRF